MSRIRWLYRLLSIYLSVCCPLAGLNEPWSEHCSAGVARGGGGRGDRGRGSGITCKSSEVGKGQQQGAR
jgi:hypothetical protein